MSDPTVEKKEAGPPPDEPVQNEPEKKKREYKEFGHEEEGPTRESSPRFPTNLARYSMKHFARVSNFGILLQMQR